MKRLSVFILTLFIAFNAGTQVLNQIGTSIKTSTETNATDFNKSQSNEENNLAFAAAPEGGTIETVGDGLKNVEGMSDELSLKTEFIFTFKLVYTAVNIYSDGEKGSVNYLNYTFNDSVFMFNEDNGCKINDYTKSKIYMLDYESKVGKESVLASPEIMKSRFASLLSNEKFSKTGKTKMIAGYMCSEYIHAESKLKKVSVWATNDNPFNDQSELVKTNINVFLNSLGIQSPVKGSHTLGIDQLNENGQIEFSIVFDSIKKEENRVNLSEYQITSY